MTRTSSRQQVTVDVGDVEIGAVELKDASSSLRANVINDGTNNALVVTQNSQPLPTGAATEATLDSLYQDFFDSLDNGTHTVRTNIVSDDVGLLKTGDATLQTIDNNTFNTYQEVQTLNTVTGTTSDTGVTGDNPGTVSAKLRGVTTELAQTNSYLASGVAQESTQQNVESAVNAINSSTASIDLKTPALGQNTMANSVPVTIASDQPIEPDFGEAVAMGLRAPEYISFLRSGRNDDVDTAAPEDIWNAGGTWTPITTAQTITLVSSSASDAFPAGTGMRVARVTGLDANYEEQIVNYPLTGTTPVVSAETWTMVHTVQGISFGSAASNVGTITVTATTDTTTQCVIAIGRGISGLSFAMVPAGYTGYLKHISGDSSNGTGGTLVTFDLMLNVFGTGGWVIPASFRARADADASFDNTIQYPYEIPEKTIIKLRAISTNNNTVVNCFYELLLKQN